jgi:capsular exopolysaccharide synthesis family protein
MNQPAASDMYQLDPFGLIKRKFGLILFFVIVAVGLAMLYYFKAPKTYESWARVFVDDQNAPMMSSDGEMVQQNNVEKYLEIISSQMVLAQAIDDGNFMDSEEGIESLKNVSPVEAMAIVRENLKATPSDTKSASDVIRIRYQSGVEEDCQKVLKNVLMSFESFLKSDGQTAGGSVEQAVNDIKTQFDLDMQKIETEIGVILQKPYIQLVEGKVYNQHEGQVAKLQEELDKLISERLSFNALYENLVDARAEGKNIEDMVVDTIQKMNEGQLGGYTATHQKYLELKVQEQEMMGDFGDDHPTLVNLRTQILMVDRMRKEQLLSALRTNDDIQDEGDFFAIISSHISNKIELLTSHESKLNAAIADAKTKSLEITKECDQLTNLLEKRTQLNQAMTDRSRQFSEVAALKNFGFRKIRIIDPATEGEQVAPSLLLSLAAGLLLGALMGLIFSALKEMAEKTFRSSEEVSKQLGVNVVTHVGIFNPRIPKDSNFKKVSGDVISLHRPQSLQSESFKALRTSIFFASQQSKAKVIQVTSPSPGDGKSTVSANLAVVMAQTGRKILMIDCDFRRPSQHTRFGLDNSVGMTSVIVGDASMNEAIQVIGLPNLHLVTSGPQFANPAELLTTDQFPNLLEELRDEYDFIILDTPPVLPVTDPAIISSYSDAIYMPMRIRNGVQVNAQRALEALATVGAQVEGIVINGLRKKDSSGYQYGGNGYGYGNAYGTYAARPAPRSNGKAQTGRIVESRN